MVVLLEICTALGRPLGEDCSALIVEMPIQILQPIFVAIKYYNFGALWPLKYSVYWTSAVLSSLV